MTEAGLCTICKAVKSSEARKFIEKAVVKRPQPSGQKWVTLLKKADSAKTVEQKKHWRRQAMRAFYGDNRGDEYA